MISLKNWQSGGRWADGVFVVDCELSTTVHSTHSAVEFYPCLQFFNHFNYTVCPGSSDHPEKIFYYYYYSTVYPGSSDPLYIVTYYKKWVTILPGHTVRMGVTNV